MTGVAVLGTGAIARVHVDGYKKFPDRCRINSLCDIYPEKAEALKSEKGVDGAVICGDYREAVDRPDIDLVSICLPPSAHGETAVFALNAGKHVLLEKPMASSLGECDAILAAAESSGKKVSVVSQNRFRTPLMRLKRVIESGAAGRILHGAVNSYWWRGQNYYDLWWRGTWEKESGGCTINHAVHHADLLIWMMGMPEKVHAFFSNLNHHNSETEDFSTAVLVYPDGSAAQLTASSPLENGFPENNPGKERELNEIYESVPELPHEGHPAQIENVLSSIESGKDLLVDGTAGRRTLELIFGIYKSAQSGLGVSFPIAGDDPFYRTETMLPILPRFHKKTKSQDNFGTTSITLGRTT